MNIHKRRITLQQIARTINPVLRGIINYYHKFQRNDMRQVWNQLNARLLKWVKWEKDYGKKKAVRYLKTMFKKSSIVCPLEIGASMKWIVCQIKAND